MTRRTQPQDPLQPVLAVYDMVEKSARAAAAQQQRDGKPVYGCHAPGPGCCSRAIPVGPIQIAAVARGIAALPTWEIDRVAARAEEVARVLGDKPDAKVSCPFYTTVANGTEKPACLIGQVRPIHCRVHHGYDGADGPGSACRADGDTFVLEAGRAIQKAWTAIEGPKAAGGVDLRAVAAQIVAKVKAATGKI